MSDKLTEKLNRGDVKAFERIMKEYAGYVFYVIGRHSCGILTREDMEEIADDTFITLWKNREKADPGRPLMPYLAVIARNLTVNRLRSQTLTVSLDGEEGAAELKDEGFEQKLEDSEALEAIFDAMDELTEKQRNIFTACYIYGESLAAISERLGYSPPDVRTTLFRAREAIRRILRERGHFDEN